MWPFKKKNVSVGPPRSKVVERPAPNVCGGKTRSVDQNAPNEITSRDITLFSASSALGSNRAGSRFGYVSAFAAPCDKGSFLYLQTSAAPRAPRTGEFEAAAVSENVFPALAGLVKELDLVRGNGKHSFTHGLPQDFGGAIEVRYSSGEFISVSNNQSPVLSAAQSEALADFFRKALDGEKAVLPNAADLTAIRFEELRKDGFRRCALSLGETPRLHSESKYPGYDVFVSETDISAETVRKIFSLIERGSMFAWGGLPKRVNVSGRESKLTFVFGDSGEITVDNDRELPNAVRGAFFDIEFELTSKR